MANFNRHLSGLDIVKRVCGQIGLPVPAAITSNLSDKTGQHMWWLLNGAGQKLLKPTLGHRWQVLKRTWTLTTDPARKTYVLPADWDSFIDQTANSSSLSLSLIGPVGDPAWSSMTASTTGPTISLMYRTRGDVFEIFSSPASPQTVLIDYSSRAWVQQMAAPVGFKDQMTLDDDLCLYDADLIQASLKLAWLQAKGFDTTTAQNDLDLALEMAINTDSDAAILNVGGGNGSPLLGVDNLPDTGYG